MHGGKPDGNKPLIAMYVCVCVCILYSLVLYMYICRPFVHVLSSLLYSYPRYPLRGFAVIVVVRCLDWRFLLCISIIHCCILSLFDLVIQIPNSQFNPQPNWN